MDERFPWLIIDKYFNDNPNALVSHHLDSYNSFFNEGINRIFKEKNPIKLMKEQDHAIVAVRGELHPRTFRKEFQCAAEKQ